MLAGHLLASAVLGAEHGRESDWQIYPEEECLRCSRVLAAYVHSAEHLQVRRRI